MAKTRATDVEGDNVLSGPWYMGSGYMNVVNAWNIARGEGVIVSFHGPGDIAHSNYRLALFNDDFDPNMTSDLWANSTKVLHAGTLTSNTDYSPCYWYDSNSGNYSMSGVDNGCKYSGAGLSELPLQCYLNHFTTNSPAGSECIDGTYHNIPPKGWTGDTPTGYSPHSVYNKVCSVLNGELSPGVAISGDKNCIPGIAPESIMGWLRVPGYDDQYFTDNYFPTYTETASINPTINRLTPDLTDASYTHRLIEPVGQNYNVLETGSNPGVISVGHCRPLGDMSGDYSTTTGALQNYGAYSGRGRSGSIMFACPSDEVWAAKPFLATGESGDSFSSVSGWVSVENDAFFSPAIFGGAMALVASHRIGWKTEDIITALYQSCRKMPYRVLPVYESLPTYLGSDITLTSGVASGDTSINIVPGNAGPGSTNWRYAIPEPGEKDIYGNDLCILQFGEDIDDPSYELFKYTAAIETTATGIKDESDYSEGVLTVERGYNSTTPKDHDWNERIFSPLLTHSGWNRYLGFGLPDVHKALRVKEDDLKIMPPWGLESSIVGGNVQLTVYPFLSSNYHSVEVRKSTTWYPQNKNDGVFVFSTTISGESISALDYDTITGNIYYSAFQVSTKKKFSELAEYATTIASGASWPINKRVGDDGEIMFSWNKYYGTNRYNYLVESGATLIESGTVNRFNQYVYHSDGNYNSINVTIFALDSSGIVASSSVAHTYSVSSIAVSTGFANIYTNYAILSAQANNAASYRFVLSGGYYVSSSNRLFVEGNNFYGNKIYAIALDSNGNASEKFELSTRDLRTLNINDFSKQKPIETSVNLSFPYTYDEFGPTYPTTTGEFGIILDSTKHEQLEFIFIKRSKTYNDKPVYIYKKQDGLYTNLGGTTQNVFSVYSATGIYDYVARVRE
jgi:hypothetical protein